MSCFRGILPQHLKLRLKVSILSSLGWPRTPRMTFVGLGVDKPNITHLSTYTANSTTTCRSLTGWLPRLLQVMLTLHQFLLRRLFSGQGVLTLRGSPPPMPTPSLLKDIRPYLSDSQPPWSLNKASLRPYFLGEWHWWGSCRGHSIGKPEWSQVSSSPWPPLAQKLDDGSTAATKFGLNKNMLLTLLLAID